MILGYLWSVKHNPHFDLSSGTVLSWGLNCKDNCFQCTPASSPVSSAKTDMFPDLNHVPGHYHDLKVFNKIKATEKSTEKVIVP